MHKFIINLAVAGATTMSLGTIAHATPPTPARNVTVVLVHGAFAESSSWDAVIPKLLARGYNVVAAANPLRGLKFDSDNVATVLARIDGPIVLVGHSYGGSVITNAATGHENVKALVYIDGTAPDAGESTAALSGKFPGGTLGPALAPPVPLPDGGKDIYIKQENFRSQFAADVPEAEAKLMFATQRPVTEAALNEPAGAPAWKTIPSWFIYGSLDKNIPPAGHAFMAKRAGARETIEVKGASHVVMISHPDEVVKLIEHAARSPWKEPSVSVVPPPPAPVAPPAARAPEQTATVQTARDVRGPAGLVPVNDEAPAKLIIDPPLADSLAHGRVVIQYRAENVRIVQVFGQAALDVSPRIGHIHVTVDNTPWHWLDASGEPLTITGLTAGPHKVLIELVNASHQTLDYGIVNFEVPYRFLTPNDPKADGFHSAPVATL